MRRSGGLAGSLRTDGHKSDGLSSGEFEWWHIRWRLGNLTKVMRVRLDRYVRTSSGAYLRVVQFE